MHLMIEAKDKEQAMFELMRTFKLPGYDLFNDMTPHVRPDENKPFKPSKKKLKKADVEEDKPTALQLIPEEEMKMGRPEGRVYWPPGMEGWLRPAKRAVKAQEGVNEEEDLLRRGKQQPRCRK
jgi:UV DNA damage endonuclease